MESENATTEAVNLLADTTARLMLQRGIGQDSKLNRIRNDALTDGAKALLRLEFLFIELVSDGSARYVDVETAFDSAEERSLDSEEATPATFVIRDLWFKIAPTLVERELDASD